MSLDTIGKRYAVQELLGSGASSEVYRALDTVSGELVAVKLLVVGQGQHRERLRARFGAEAAAMQTLRHPNVLRVLDVGIEGDQDYMVTEVCTGSLYDWQQQNGRMGPRLALQYTLQILAGLAAAHVAGIVHRDIKPHNLLLHADGTLKISDFGIARLLDVASQRTLSGVAMGSLSFMAPEQRLDASSAGPPADIYSTGATLYNLLSAANPADLFLAGRDSPRWEGVPTDLAEVIRRATAVQADDRYASAPAMAVDVLACLSEAHSEPVAPIQLPLSEEYVPTAEFEPEPERGRVRRTDAGDLLLGEELWLRREEHRRSRFKRSHAAWWLALAILLPALLLAYAGDRWLTSTLEDHQQATQAADTTPSLSSGTWTGIWNDEAPMTMALVVSRDGVTGTSEVALGAHQLQSALKGSFDPATGLLRLTDRAGTGDYRLRLHGRALKGSYRLRRSQDEIPVSLVWAE